MATSRLKHMLVALAAMLGILAAHGAAGDPVNWYLTVTYDNWTTQSSTQFVESGTANVYTISGYSVTAVGFKFGVRDGSWSSTQYGWVENVTAADQAFSIANTGQCNGWASIPIGTYDVTVNLSALTIRFDTPSGSSSDIDDSSIDYWYLAGDFSSWSLSSTYQFTQSQADSDVFTLEFTAPTLDEWNGFSFALVSASWTTKYNCPGGNLSELGTAYQMAQFTDNTNAYCNAMTEGDSYTLTWNRANRTLEITANGSGGGSSVSSSFVRGADISWCTEMEADGKKFYNAQGVETDIFALMKQIGMTAIRLRVWVNPSSYGYGAWCDKADVVAKAVRAAAQGLDVMIDFHYSDIFADPVTQTKPVDWTSANTAAKAAQKVAEHTTDVLTALQTAGVTPKWVQVGNETRYGMVWNVGRVNNNDFSNYVTLSNAGYDAVKAVFPNAIVIVHMHNAWDASSSNTFYSGFQNAGGKFDMIGLSHYPDYSDWNSTSSGVASNRNAVSNISTLATTFGKDVMVVETGFDSSAPALAKQVMEDFFDRVADVSACKGIFYWEPEVYGNWKPTYYNTVGWNAYNMGGFTSTGKPSQVLDPFKSSASQYPDALTLYDEAGENILGYLTATTDGVYSGTLTSSVDWFTFQVVDEYDDVWYRTDTSDFWSLTTTGEQKFWLGAYGTHTINVDLTQGTWSYTRQVEDTDNWYLYSYGNWEFDKPFTQSTQNSDVFTLENFTVTSENLDQYGGLSFHIISANWTEAYSYNANVSAEGSYTLLASGGEGVWGNIYANFLQPGIPYTLTWNRVTHVLTIAGPSTLTLNAASAVAPTHTAGYYNVRATLHLEGGKWNMVCLPFFLDRASLEYYFGSNVKLAKFTDATRTVHSNAGAGAPRRANSATGVAEFTTCTAEGLTANTPYLLNPSTDVESLSIDNKWVEASNPATVTNGSYSLVGTNAASTAAAGNYFIDSSGNFIQAAGSETIPAMGAYIASSSGASLAGEGLSFRVDNVVTGIRDVTAAESPADGRVFDTQGRCVGTSLDGLPAGIYITGSRKVIVR